MHGYHGYHFHFPIWFSLFEQQKCFIAAGQDDRPGVGHILKWSFPNSTFGFESPPLTTLDRHYCRWTPAHFHFFRWTNSKLSLFSSPGKVWGQLSRWHCHRKHTFTFSSFRWTRSTHSLVLDKSPPHFHFFFPQMNPQHTFTFSSHRWTPNTLSLFLPTDEPPAHFHLFFPQMNPQQTFTFSSHRWTPSTLSLFLPSDEPPAHGPDHQRQWLYTMGEVNEPHFLESSWSSRSFSSWWWWWWWWWQWWLLLYDDDHKDAKQAKDGLNKKGAKN